MKHAVFQNFHYAWSGESVPFQHFLFEILYEKNTPSFPPELSHFFGWVMLAYLLSPVHPRFFSQSSPWKTFIKYFSLGPFHTIFSFSTAYQRSFTEPSSYNIFTQPNSSKIFTQPCSPKIFTQPSSSKIFLSPVYHRFKKNILYKTTGAIANPSFGILFFSTLCHPHYPL